MKAKDAFIAILTWFGLVIAIGAITNLDRLPMWILLILAAIAWSGYLLIAVRDHEREKRALKNPVIWMIIPDENGNRRWVAMDGSGRTRPLNSPPPEQPVQETEKEAR